MNSNSLWESYTHVLFEFGMIMKKNTMSLIFLLVRTISFADGDGTPPPPPPPPPPLPGMGGVPPPPLPPGLVENVVDAPKYERFIPLELERALANWTVNVREDKGTVVQLGGGREDFLAEITRGKLLKKGASSNETTPKAKSFVEDILDGHRDHKGSRKKLVFSKFLGADDGEERLQEICNAKKKLSDGYDLVIDEETKKTIHIDTIAKYEVFRKEILARIREIEHDIEKMLSPFKEAMRSLRVFIADIIENDSGRTYDQIKVLKNKYLDEPSSDDRYPKVLKFFALTEWLKLNKIINQEQYDFFVKKKKFFEEGKAFRKIQEVTTKKEFLKKLRKHSNFKPEILKLISLKEAVAIEQLTEAEILSQKPEIIEPEDQQQVLNNELRIYFLKSITEKIEEIFDTLCAVAGIRREEYLAYVSEENEKYKEKVEAYCKELSVDLWEKDAEAWMKTIEIAINGKKFFPLENPTEEKGLDLSEEIKHELALANRKISSGSHTEGSLAWAVRLFQDGLGENYDIIKAFGKYEDAEASYLKTKKRPLILFVEARSFLGRMRLFKEKMEVLGKTSLNWVGGLRVVMDFCKERIKTFLNENKAILEKQKSSERVLKSFVAKSQNVPLDPREVSALEEKMRSSLVDAAIQKPYRELKKSEELKGKLDVDQFLPAAKKLEQLQTAIERSGLTSQVKLIGELETAKKINADVSSKAKTLSDENVELREKVQALERELEEMKRKYQQELKSKQDELEGLRGQFKAAQEQWDAEKADFEKNEGNLREEIKNLLSKIGNLGTRNDSLEAENETLRNRPEPEPKVIGGSGSTIIRTNNEEVQALRNELGKNKAVLGTQAREMKEKDDRIHSLTNTVANLRQKLSETEEKANKNSRRSTDVFGTETDDLEVLRQNLSMIQQELAERQNALLKLQTEQETRAKELDRRENAVKAREDKYAATTKIDSSGNATEKVLPNDIRIGDIQDETGVSGENKTSATIPVVKPQSVRVPTILSDRMGDVLKADKEIQLLQDLRTSGSHLMRPVQAR